MLDYLTAHLTILPQTSAVNFLPFPAARNCFFLSKNSQPTPEDDGWPDTIEGTQAELVVVFGGNVSPISMRQSLLKFSQARLSFNFEQSSHWNRRRR